MAATARWRPDRLDLYTLRLFAAPLIFALATLLLAQMLERLLRLFDLAASTGASTSLPRSGPSAPPSSVIPDWASRARYM